MSLLAKAGEWKLDCMLKIANTNLKPDADRQLQCAELINIQQLPISEYEIRESAKNGLFDAKFAKRTLNSHEVCSIFSLIT